jgi:pyruvate formate lyase activating enzyme
MRRSERSMCAIDTGDGLSVQARFYTKLEDNICRCDTCPRGCVIKPGKKGFCLSRENVDGELVSALYGGVAALHTDPIEKKPLYHFFPGSQILSIGTIGCNLACRFCQNWQLSRGRSFTDTMSPEQVIAQAKGSDSIGIAYTYNEPLIWYEFVYDCCKLARAAGLKNVLVTNGTLNPEPFDELLPLVDAMNVDLKGDARFYRELADSVLDPVKRNIAEAAKSIHVEVTNLLVTGENDSEKQVRELVDFVASIDRKTPLHFSRYFPNYKLKNEPTPLSSLERAYSIAREKLDFVYLGNVSGPLGSDTVCPNCGAVSVKRNGYFVQPIAFELDGSCAACGHFLGIVAS